MKPKKHLGQHFLTSQSYVRRIVEAGNVKVGDVVLEIGPGKGILTEQLLLSGAYVIAIEKDADMLPILEERFPDARSNGTLRIVHGDVRDIDLAKFSLREHRYKLIANIPYYITGELLRMFLASDMQPSTIVFLVQKEVAERVIARNGKESLLSLSIKAFGTPSLVATVKAGNFSPPPKVDSAILAIRDISHHHFKNNEREQRFFELLHAGFAHKRKLLKKNLESVSDTRTIQTAYMECGLPENVRAEDVPPEKWLCLLESCTGSK